MEDHFLQEDAFTLIVVECEMKRSGSEMFI